MPGAMQEHDCESLPALLQGDGVVGVSRLRIAPAFIGPTICTLVYLADAVRIAVVDARGFVPSAFRGTITRPLQAMRCFGPLASWGQLRAAAVAATSCDSLCLDGVGYRHALLDWQGGTESSWSNPNWFAHRRQCELAKAYEALIESSGILLEQGSRVRIRTGLLAGFVGRVERLERGVDQLRIVAELGGKAVSLSLLVNDVEFSPEATAEQGARASRSHSGK